MRFRLATVCFALLAAVIVLAVPLPTAPDSIGVARASVDQALVMQQMVAMPLAFTENRGQWDDRVLFRTSAGGATVWFCRDGIYYQFIHHLSNGETDPSGPNGLRRRGLPGTEEDMSSVAACAAKEDSVETVVVKAAFAHANPTVEITGEDPLAYRCNYFLGNDPSKWHTDVPNYTGVVYRDIYPGVDAHITGAAGQLQTKWEAKPDADLSQVQFRYEGNASVTQNDAGELMIAAPWGTLMQSALIRRDGGSGDAYQITGGASYVLSSLPWTASSTGATLMYSTYLGGGGEDGGFGIAVDASGSSYVTGFTYSTNFPTQNPLQKSIAGVDDAFVTKLSATGSALVYSTYLGGTGLDYCNGIAVDGDGDAYVTGITSSTDLPIANAMQSANAGNIDAFVAKLSPSGGLAYGTYLGGSSEDYGNAIAVDGSGSAYVTGLTGSTDFPLVHALQPLNAGNYDVFVTKLSSSGTSLGYSTYLGGRLDDFGLDITIDVNRNAYLTGWTGSIDFPTGSPLQAAKAGGLYDAFVTKVSEPGTAMVFSTYLGGSLEDRGFGIAVDGSRNSYVTGWTQSTDFPNTSSFRSANSGGVDAFVTKLSPSGLTLVYSRYVGGSGTDLGLGIAVDGTGNASVAGQTFSTDFPTANPIQAANGGSLDVFVTKLSSAGSTIKFSTYLGGISVDYGSGIAIDLNGSVCVTGETDFSGFPIRNPYDGSFNGVYDAFVAKINIPRLTCLPDITVQGLENLPPCDENGVVTTDNCEPVSVKCSRSSVGGVGCGDAPVTVLYTYTAADACGDSTSCQRTVTVILPPCDFPCHADPVCDGVLDVRDVVNEVGAAFRAGDTHPIQGCAYVREDVDCDGQVDILDVTKMVNVAFRAGDPATQFCNRCP